MLDLNPILDRLTAVCDHYERSSPEVHRWADDLYQRIGRAADTVVLSEILFAGRLLEDGLWMHPNTAQNQLYHLAHRLKRPVGLMADY
jgi:hypothetical protein